MTPPRRNPVYTRRVLLDDTNESPKNLWISMSMLEISNQARFAELAFKNIDLKAKHGTDAVFSSIHSFLSHCAMISKLLKAADLSAPPRSIGDVLGVERSSLIHDREFRNNLEHYDERLKSWIGRFGTNVTIETLKIGPKSVALAPSVLLVSHYDPSSNTFTFVNEDFDLTALHKEAQRIGLIAASWTKSASTRGAARTSD
jgi:hypothetical protein